MSQEVAIKRFTAPKTVTWAGANDSKPVTIDGGCAGLQLLLPAAFVGTTLTYKMLMPDRVTWVPIQKAGSNVSDTVAGSADSCNVLDAGDLFGITDLIITSDQSETCVGTLLVTA